MLNEEEKKYLSSTRLSVKLNYVELEEDYDDGNIFYYYGKAIVISTINSETYIDRDYYNGDRLNKLLCEIFECLDTTEIILPEEFIDVDIIKATFNNLKCNTLNIYGEHKLSLEQLMAINENTDIKELKVPKIDKNIGSNQFKFKIIPKINNKFTSEKFNNFIIDDILRFKTLNIELPLKADYVDDNNQEISEYKDLDTLIDLLVDIDNLYLEITDYGNDSIVNSFEIIDKIEKSIGSKIENIYYVTGNHDIINIDMLKKLETDHKVSIMYDKEIICSIDDFLNMRHCINKILEPVKLQSLSPLEQTLLVYDIVKDFYIVNHKYMKEKKVSRYVHRIFKVNELNCQAYATLYAQLLQELNIQASDYSLYSPLVEEIFLTQENHARTMIHLVDEKYDINGLFSSDVIWDAIKKSKNNYHYEFFLTKVRHIKRQFATDKFNNEIDFLFNDKSIDTLSIKEKQFYERLLNLQEISDYDIQDLRNVMKNNISFKVFLEALSTVRVAQNKDKDLIKKELLSIVNRNNNNGNQDPYVDLYPKNEEELKSLDIITLEQKNS